MVPSRSGLRAATTTRCVQNRGVPVYEYRCQNCKAKFSALVGMVAAADDSKCPKCGSVQTDKLVSRFARYRSEDDRVDELADRIETMGEPDSPQQMRSIMREMGKALDEDSSDEMEELFEADMAGELEDEE
jgi:putative FmdB family regulatory protein